MSLPRPPVASRRRHLGTALRLAPAVAPVLVLCGWAAVDGVAASFGSGAGSSGSGAGTAAYGRVLSHPGFWPAYGFSLWIAAAGTLIAVCGAVAVGFAWTSRPGRRRTVQLWVLQVNVSLPHLVWAVALVATFSPSGWVSRLAATAGLIDRPDQFPLLVNDHFGVGIIGHLVTKEVPFLVLASLPLAGHRLAGQLRQAATLGAPRWAQLRLVYLPGVAPALVPASLAAFAFALGAYEPAAVLGVQRPRTLAVVAVEYFRDPDLARRADAFVLSAVLLTTTVGVALVAWAVARRWSTVPSGRR